MTPLFLLTLTILATLVTVASPSKDSDNIDNKTNVTAPFEVNAMDVNRLNYMKETFYMVKGTITKVNFIDLSKTSKVQHFHMDLYLKTTDSPHKDLHFYKYPVDKFDKQLSVGQAVSIVAQKNNLSGASGIVYIASPDDPLFVVYGTITKVIFTNISKSIFSKKWIMHLHLQTPDSPNKELKFIKTFVSEYDKRVFTGQVISVAAIKNDSSEYSDIICLFTGE